MARERFVNRSGVARTLFLSLAGIGSLGNLAFNNVITDRLASAQANDVRSVLAGLSAVGFLALGLQLSLVGWLGKSPSQRSLRSPVFNRAFLATSVVLGLSTGAVASVFITSTTAYRLQVGLFVAVTVGATMAAVPARAELLSGEQWVRLGLLFVVSPAIRLIIGLLWFSDSRNSWNLLPMALGEIVAFVVATLQRPQRSSIPSAGPPMWFVVKGALASVGLLITLTFSSLAFRSRLGDTADAFTESALVARGVLFVPLTILSLYFPAIARSPLGSRGLRRAYVSGLVWTSGVALGVAIALVLLPQQLGHLIVTGDARLSTTVIRLLALAGALTAITIVSLLLYIAHGSRLSLTAWGGAAIITAGQLLATTAIQLATVALVASAALLVAVSVPAMIRVQPVLHARTATSEPRSVVPRGDIALIIPCYNPGPSVVATIRSSHDYLAELGMRTSIIVVCDGSTDGSPELVDAIELPSVQQIRHSSNRGKGAALRTGFEVAHAEFIAFIDADGDLSPSLLGSLLMAQQSFDADIVFGSKLHPDSEVAASPLRRMYSFGYQMMIRLLFQLDIHDTQTGIKVFRHQVIEAVLPTLNEEQFALDLELFISARAAGFTNFVEVPVTLRRESGSTISPRAVVRMCGDTMRLFWRAKIALAYTRFAAQSPGVLRTTSNADDADNNLGTSAVQSPT